MFCGGNPFLSIEKFGKAPSFWVRKDGQIYTAVDYALVDKKNASRLKEAIPANKSKEQITQMEIENILNSKKNPKTTTPISYRRYHHWCDNDSLLWFLIFNYSKFSHLDVSLFYCQ